MRKMVYLGDLVAIMEERDFDRDAIDTDSLESEVMELIYFVFRFNKIFNRPGFNSSFSSLTKISALTCNL